MVVLAVAFGLFARARLQVMDHRLRFVLMASASGTIIYFLATGPQASIRLAGALLPLTAIASWAVLERALTAFGKQRAHPWSSVLAATLAAVFIGRVAANELPYLQVPLQAPNERIKTAHLGGAAIDWLWKKQIPAGQIASLGDNMIYYLAPLKPWVVRDDGRLESLLLERIDHSGPLSAAVFLKSLGFRYLLDVWHWQGMYWGEVAAQFSPLIAAHPASIVFEANQARVIDLDILLNEAGGTRELIPSQQAWDELNHTVPGSSGVVAPLRLPGPNE
jgi:hypothetical protein